MHTKSQRHLRLRTILITVLLFWLTGCVLSTDIAPDFEGKERELAIAASNGNVKEVARLIEQEGVDPNTIFNETGQWTLLSWALHMGNLDGVRALLESGADPNVRTSRVMNGKRLQMNSAMYWATRMRDTRFLELLLQHGGDPNQRTASGSPLLHEAFLTGNNWENVKLLVKYGADVNEDHHSVGNTILALYTGRGGFSYAYWLLQHGADPTLSTDDPRTAKKPVRMMMVEDIYWLMTTPDNLPWQKKCQQWLIERGIERPPMPESIRRQREAFGFPTREDDIPLL